MVPPFLLGGLEEYKEVEGTEGTEETEKTKGKLLSALSESSLSFPSVAEYHYLR